MSHSKRYGTRYNEPPHASIVNHPNVALIDISNVVNKAIVNAGRGNASYGETLAELNQTGTMFKSGVARSIMAVNFIRRKQFRKAADVLGLSLSKRDIKKKSRDRSLGKIGKETASEAANRHLLIQFGILPIVDDIHTAIKLFEGKLNKAPKKGDVVIGYASETSNEVLDTRYYHPHGGKYYFPCKRRIDITCKIRYVCTNESLLYAANQLGLANPAKLAYDLLPLSFVVDWFLPIGDYLETMSSTYGLTKSEGFCSVYAESKCSIGEQYDTGYGGGRLVEDPSLDVSSFQRHYITGTPRLPGLSFKPLGIGKSMTALSLLAQRLG
jgi:hypothetical protein